MKRFFTILILICIAIQTYAEIKLPKLVSDGMVLQRDIPLKIWGWASPAEEVKLVFKSKSYQTKANDNGEWQIILPSQHAGGPFTMELSGENKIIIQNILIGDVWLCSGQSNMVIPMERVKEKYPLEIAASTNSSIRHFFIPTAFSFGKEEKDLPGGKWLSADPHNILQFSATAYFFAKKLFEKYKIPIGLINASVGGPPVESWISEAALIAFPHYMQKAAVYKNPALIDSINKARNAIYEKWYENINRKDKGLNGAIPWHNKNFNAVGWPTMQLPGYWNQQGKISGNGVVWFRKEIELPASMANKPAKLFLGTIVDADSTFVNGKFVGNITYQYPPRRYTVPKGVLAAGKNIITIRVVSNSGNGGFTYDKPFYLVTGNDTLDLKDAWAYQLGVSSSPLVDTLPNISYQPTGLYNAMIAPLVNYAIKGVNWYQGEGNTGRPHDYHALLKTMIQDWRNKWQQGNFPFLFVQLPNFGEVHTVPSESNWAMLREQQLKTLSVPNTAMVVAIDLGEWNDLHPLNKKDVGERLALAARKLAYGENKIVYSGPLYQSHQIKGNRIIVRFTHTGSGLKSLDGKALRGFAISGADSTFRWANVKMEKDQVIAWHDDIPNPVALRYAWADNPGLVNLYNKEGLPASPFRTDHFKETNTYANKEKPWNNKRAAVVLTYDDALNVHLDHAWPLLDSLNLKATFYVSGATGVLHKRMHEWKIAASNGHELGNHTMFHPCDGSLPGRSFVQPEYDLATYTVKRMVEEITMTNALLQAMDGKTNRTFAYPCGDRKVDDSFYFASLQKDFAGARGVGNGMLALQNVDRYNINCIMVNGQKGDDLISHVKKAIKEKKLLVFLFHGVGGEHGLNVSLEAHKMLLEFLKQNEKDIWIAPMVDVAEFIAKNK